MISINLTELTRPETKLLAAHLISAWMIIHYAPVPKPIENHKNWLRPILTLVTVFVICRNPIFSILSLVLSIPLTFSQPTSGESKEPNKKKDYALLINIILVAIAFLYAGHYWGSAASPIIILPCSNDTITSMLFHIAGACFVLTGGSQIVVAILGEKADYIATGKNKTETSQAIARAGRLIGMLERTFAYLLLIQGQYAAIGLLIAAKGIIRSKEIEETPGFGEYVLVGTLSSIGVAAAAAWVFTSLASM